MTRQFFYISDITNSSSFNGKIFRKKSTLENFRANLLKGGIYNFQKVGVWVQVLSRVALRTFARNVSNIDFFPKILPLKDDELVMSEM